MNINPQLQNIDISLIRQISIKSREYNDVINLTIGEPDLPIPLKIVEETTNFMKNHRMGYPPLGGIPKLKKKIMDFYNKKYDTLYNLDEIVVTAGATEAISTTLKTILEKGDEVLIPTPFYPGYIPNIYLNGGNPIFIDTSKDKFQLTVENLKNHITPKTKAIVLNYPNNPSGIILTKKNMDNIVEFLSRKNIYIISDEIYSEIIFEDDFISFGRYPVLKDKLIIINGFSKSHSMTGWRLGYILTSKKLQKELLKVHQYTVTSPSIISQYGGYVALSKCSDISSNKAEYKKRSNYVYERLNKIGIPVIQPKGAFYLLCSLNNYNFDSSVDFAMTLLHSKQVAVVPGVAFGVENYFRISCTQPINILKIALDRIEDFIKGERQND